MAPPTARPGDPDPRVEEWLKGQPRGLRDLCAAAQLALREALPGSREQLKWGHPTWVGAGNVVALQAHAEHVNLQFYRGADLPDPSARLEGTGRLMRHVKLRHARDLKDPAVKGLVRAAWRLDQGAA